MACMCGDICCPSCGPAQGNHKCPACGNWESDGGCENPVECERICKEQAEGEYRELLVMDVAELLAAADGVWIGEWDGDFKALEALTNEQLEAKKAELKGK